MDDDTISDPRRTPVDDRDGEAAEPLTAITSGAPIPDSIGGYRIIRPIATGGMGAVYEARQDNPNRTVALKVIRPGRASRANLRRFEHEAEVLGRLHHAGIAQVYEAGAADTGLGPQPFFAMEYIEGVALTVYANQQDLGVRARLELIGKVCDAVEHAHQKGVIHRDLKPTNILVDGEGQPKILDFGVARSIDADVQATIMTQTGELVGTLSYMSPEQVAGDPAEIDTRSDVYALGVLTFELLTDQMPYPLAGRGITEIARIIREREPTWLGEQRRSLRGDVETIVAKALEKDKARRYQSVAEMAADIRRHLEDQPIVARPPSLAYQFGKFARRHRAAVAAGVVAMAALVIGLVGASYGLLEARREASRAENMNEFLLQRLLTAAVPDNAFGPDVRVVDVLDRARETLGESFAGEPEIEADLALALAKSYIGLSVLEHAAGLAERARHLRTELYGEGDARTLDASHEAAAIRLARGDYEAAYSRLGEVWQLRVQALGPNHRDTLTTRNDMAESLFRLGDLEGAIDMKREVLEARKEALGDDHPDAISARAGLADLLAYDGRYDESEELFVEALNLLDVAGAPTPRTILALQGLSRLYWFRNQTDEARATAQRAIEVATAVHGDDHPAVGEAMTSLAFALRREDEYEEAERLLRGAYEIFLQRHGERAEATTTARHNLANVIADQGRIVEAEPVHLANLEHRRREHGTEHPLVAETLGGMGKMYNDSDRFDLAAEKLAEALRIYRLSYNDDNPEVATTLSNLAFALRKGERWTEAAGALRELMVIDTRQLGRTHEWVLEEYEDLIEVLSAAGDFVAAEAYALERLAITDEDLTPEDDAYWRSKLLLGRLYYEHRRYADAESPMLEAFAGYGPDYDPEHPHHKNAIEWLAQLYTDWGRPEEAARYRAMLEGGGAGV